MEKDEIITKIREVAHTLNGKSPSLDDMKKFANISEKDWRRYWARWSDAVTEAGYEPNNFSTPKLGKEYIIKEMLTYFRSIHKIPIQREMQIYKRNNPSFPSIEAINNNFDKKGYFEIKRELLSYCINNKEYSDLIPLFEKDNISLKEPTFHKETKVKDKNARFKKIISHIQSWSPKRRRNVEETYKTELRGYLETLGYEIAEEHGESQIDILINKTYAIEIKKNPNLSEYDRMFGQLARHMQHHKNVIALIMDASTEDHYSNFVKLVDKYLNKEGYEVEVIKK